MTDEQRERMIRHAAWKAHQASGCTCGMDNPPTADVEMARVVIDTVEFKIRNDERRNVIDNVREYAAKVGVVSSRALEEFAAKLEEATAS